MADPVAERVLVPAVAGETIARLNVPGTDLFLRGDRVCTWEEIVMAGPVGSNPSASDQPRDVNSYLTAYGLWPTLNATRSLLLEMFGAGVSLTPSVQTDRESGKPALLFEIRTEPSRSYEDQRAFLTQYLARVPRPANAPSPTLFWDAPVAAV